MKKLSIENYEEVHDYLKRWVNHEYWDDLSVMLEEGDTEMAADRVVSSGAIDPETCYPEFKRIEKLVLRVANKWRKLSQKKQQERMDSVFRLCFIASCNNCNHVSFVNCGNEELYPEVKDNCWSCGSPNIETYYWQDK